MSFRVAYFAQAETQLRALAQRAAEIGIYPVFSETIQRIDERLRQSPLDWGDPEYNTKHPGGVVCHGIDDQLLVRFAVYEGEQAVIIIEVQALPTSPLA